MLEERHFPARGSESGRLRRLSRNPTNFCIQTKLTGQTNGRLSMNTKRRTEKSGSNSARCECSVEAVSQRLFERAMTIAEVVELSEKCGLWDIERNTQKSFSRPLTFVVPATQTLASVSRMVE